MVSDNGPQYGSAEFRTYCKEKGIRHVTSSPEYPQSNGMAERAVQTIKDRLLKMFKDGQSLWDALAAVRSTPVSGSLPSPAVLLQGRNLRGTLPFSLSALQSRVVPVQATASFQQTRPVDARTSSLQVGQQVRVRLAAGNRPGKWISGRIAKVCQQPNSYVVRTSDGRYFRRNRVAINIDRAPAAVQHPPAFCSPVLPPHGLHSELPSRTPPVVPPPTPQPSTPNLNSPVEGLVGSPFHGFSSPARADPAPSEPATNEPESSGTTRSGRSYLAPGRRLF